MAASAEMQGFFQYLAKNQEEQDRFRNIENQDEAIKTAVEVADRNGFSIDEAEMRSWLQQEQGGEGKLDKEMLEQVAGGSACWTKTGYSSCPCESGYCASGC